MGYIIKDNQGLLVTRITDIGRQKISQGNFNIRYFQVGDSEINYTAVTNYNFTNGEVLEPSYNAQNGTGVPQSNKNDVKYPFYLQSTSSISYGIPFMASSDESVYNTATPNCLFYSSSTVCFSPRLSSNYTYNSEYTVDLSTVGGAAVEINLVSDPCGTSSSGTISAGTFVVFYLSGDASCTCFKSNYPILTAKVLDFNTITNKLTIDRYLPNLSAMGFNGYGRCFFYASGMDYYDLPTPMNYWSNSVINYESVCVPENGYVNVWNMNIPWSENPAGLNPTIYNPYTNFSSVNYLGTKEYYGYSTTSGQTDTSSTYYYNSFLEKINVEPENQKAIAILHYTNNTIINFYGEKFATEIYDSGDPGATGQARNFKLHLPWLMWHKNTGGTEYGETFYIDPAGFDNLDLLTPHYIKSNKNSDMNSPGIRYYHLWDTHANSITGEPNRIGKVFPDDKIIVIDDEEIIAAMTYLSNRNYTLPAPKLGLIAPGSCGSGTVTTGVLSGDTETLWVTYGFGGEWEGMHCNYYQNILGPSLACATTDQNVTVSFGEEFTYLNTNLISGYSANEFYILAQRTIAGQKPNPSSWKYIDMTSTLSNYIAGNGYIQSSGMTELTFVITSQLYDSAITYDLGAQIEIPLLDDSSQTGFGDEYFFYGTLETDIQATIYEMKYLINLPINQFVKSSNPTWVDGTIPYMTEIGLYDSDKNLLVLSKFQSPQIRQGIQQAVVKLDF
jgi:hypothetical protein